MQNMMGRNTLTEIVYRHLRRRRNTSVKSMRGLNTLTETADKLC